MTDTIDRLTAALSDRYGTDRLAQECSELIAVLVKSINTAKARGPRR